MTTSTVQVVMRRSTTPASRASGFSCLSVDRGVTREGSTHDRGSQEKVSRTTEVRKRRYHAQDKIEKVSRIVGREIVSRLLGREDIAHKDRKDMTL